MMNSPVPWVSTGAFVGRDRLALIGVICWVLALGLWATIILMGRAVSLRDLVEGSLPGIVNALIRSFQLPLLPFAVGAVFLVPRLRFLRRVQDVGRAVPAVILERADETGGRRQGSRIVYGYEVQGQEYRAELRTYGVVGGLALGEEVTVLVDPERPDRPLLPAAYL